MKTRRWIVVIALFIGFTTLVLYHGWNLFEANEKIKNYLIEKIRPVLGEDFTIKGLDMSIGAVHLKGVELSLKEGYFFLRVEDVRLGFNFFNLIKSGFRPQKIPQDVIFVKPHLIIRATHKTVTRETAVDTSLLELDIDKYLKKFENYTLLKRITISKGKISYIDSIGQNIMLGNDVSGWLSTKELGVVSARLVGKIFQSKNFNLSITGKVDMLKGRLDLLNVKVKNYRWNERNSFFLPDYVDVSDGTIDGTLTLRERSAKGTTGFDIQGKVAITDGAFKITDKNIYFDDINLETEVKDWNFIIDNSRILFNGSPVEISGKIKNILKPQLDLTVTSAAFDIKKFVDYLSPDPGFKIRGKSSISFHLTNTFENPTFHGELKSAEIVYNDKRLYHTRAKIFYKDSVLRVDPLKTQLEGLDVSSSWQMSFSHRKESVRFSLLGEGNVFHRLINLPIKSLQQSKTHLRIKGDGDFRQVSGTIAIATETFSQPDTTFRFKGKFSYAQKKLKLNLSSSTHGFHGEGEMVLFTSVPEYKLVLTDVHDVFNEFPELKKLRHFFNLKESVIRLNRKGKSYQLVSGLTWEKKNGNFPRSANLVCSMRSDEQQQEIDGNLVFHSGGKRFNGSFSILKNTDYWEIRKLNIENILLSSGRMSLDPDHTIEANIIFPDTPLGDLGRLIVSDAKAIQQGRLYGSIGIFGPVKNPNVSCKLVFNNLKLNNMGIYDGTTSFNLIDKKFKLKEFTIKRNKETIVTTTGSYEIDTDKLDVTVKGNHIDLNSTLIALYNKPGLLEGIGKVEIELKGTSKHPRLFGTVEIDNGKVTRFSFDRLFLDMGDALSDTLANDIVADSTLRDGINFRQFTITRNGQFRMEGGGYIPFSNEASLDFRLTGRGNLLSLLPELTPFIKETKSNGNWDLHLSGAPGNIVVSGGKIELSDGYIRLRDVAPEIKNITMKAQLEQDGFLNVEYISGTVRRKPFTFRNYRSLPNVHEKNLETFSISDLGLDLGIFTFETSPKGIPLHIPGLMEKGEFGNFAFLGKDGNEKFYVAGPINRPYLNGTLLLQNVNFTFPFIKSKKKKKPSKVVEVLRSIEWDVHATTGKDLHYQRQIPSGLDNVYVDLIIDSGVGGLDFSGIINDKSFRVAGVVESSRGNVEYLNLDFQVTKAGAEFDKSTLLPIVYGEARTTVTDSTGFPYYVYLTLLTVDKETGHAQKRGRIGEVSFQLSSENSTLGDSEGEILASLGYSATNIREMATEIIGISTDNLLFRPLFRPFERKLEQKLGLDMVRFSSRFTRNLIEMNVNDQRNFQINSKLFLLRSTKVMIGKYLANQLFLLYSGQLEAGMDYRYQHEGFGLSHKFGLEYRINPSLLLQMEYEYNSLLLWRREDKRILLRHSFPF